MKALILLAAALFGGSALAASQDELLPPEVAFVIEVQAIDTHTLRARWIIAEGYFMYREKISFSTSTPGYRIGGIEFPPGKIKDDPYFGRTETYRHQIMVDLPLQRDPGSESTLTLVARSQGCADLGVCYPPQTRELSIMLPTASNLNEPADRSLLAAIGQ